MREYEDIQQALNRDRQNRPDRSEGDDDFFSEFDVARLLVVGKRSLIWIFLLFAASYFAIMVFQIGRAHV